MKKFCLLFSLVCLSQMVMAIDGNDDNVTRDYYVELYKTQRYIPDFDQVFGNLDWRDGVSFTVISNRIGKNTSKKVTYLI